MDTIIWCDDLGRDAVDVAGGHGADLGELTPRWPPGPAWFRDLHQ